MKDLPNFKPRPYKQVLSYIAQVLTNERAAQVSSLQRVVTFEDGHYRAIFMPDYFQPMDGEGAPSKSQWNTLKKRMKRLDKNVFIFKEHGEIPCDAPATGMCYYIDFGFLEPEDSRARQGAADAARRY